MRGEKHISVKCSGNNDSESLAMKYEHGAAASIKIVNARVSAKNSVASGNRGNIMATAYGARIYLRQQT